MQLKIIEMKIIKLKAAGFKNLSIENQAISTPGTGEVLIKVHAVSLNHVDMLVSKGKFPVDMPFPFTPASDASGIIEAVGAGVTNWKKGDKVITNYIVHWQSGKLTPEAKVAITGQSVEGVLAEYIVVPAHSINKMPNNLSMEEAATLPVAGLTAWTALVEYGKVQAGDTVLVQGTGGVSLLALQLAKVAGAKVIALTSNDKKAAMLKALGADEVINYTQFPAWDEKVKELTNGKGADKILDVVGGDSINKSLHAVKMEGYIGVIGIIDNMQASVFIPAILQSGVTIKGVFVGNREQMDRFVRAIEINNIKPVIDRVFPLEEISDAYEYLESGKHFGKVVITL